MVAGTRLRFMSWLLVVTLIFFIAASGSRTALLTTIVFFSAYVLAWAFASDRRLLWAGAGLVLLMVPLSTFGYPMMLGVHTKLIPQPQLQDDSRPILSAPACVRTAFTACPRDPGVVKPDSRAGGFLGLKKELGTGRETIWPAVIEMGARAPMLGHGLGSFPGAYLAPPYTGMHAHSGFVQAYYQFGLVGLGLYVLLWCVLFARAIGLPNVGARTASVAVLCAACVLDTFEVIFLQANLGIGVALGILATTEFPGPSEG
jgi:O-antigen ligase